MLRYEIKKVFSKSKNRIAVIVLFVILVITSILTINKVEFVDENGNSSVGISASRDLREAKNQWAGYLTTDTLSKALEENKTINSSKEALSDDITEQNKAYAKKQGIAGIMDVIIYAFSDYRDYNYYVPDHISDDEVGTIYERRISTLKNWLESGGETFSQAEKDFMIQKYEELKANLYQDMVDKIISREEYREIKQTFSKKIVTAKESLKGLEEKKKRMLSNEMRTQQWVTEFKQHRNIQSLDRKTVVMLIDRIVVYSADRIEIHFNYEDEISEFVKYAYANSDLVRRKVGEL